MTIKAIKVRILVVMSVVLLMGCSTTSSRKLNAVTQIPSYSLPTESDTRFNHDSQPSVDLQNDACALLNARPHWKRALQSVRDRWRVEPWYVLAFLYQESRFQPNAISPSRAYGYAQVKDDSWQWYQIKTGRMNSKRERFDDAVDFIGFYAMQNVRRNGVALNDVKNQYLAYHEGMGGFERKIHLKKPWLLTVSDKVADRAALYQAQLLDCEL